MTNEGLAYIIFAGGRLLLMGIGMNMALVLTGAGMAAVLCFWDTQLLAQNLTSRLSSCGLRCCAEWRIVLRRVLKVRRPTPNR